MKAMLSCDLACMKSLVKSTMFTMAIIALMIFMVSGSSMVVIPCVICSVSVSVLVNLLAIDEQDDWQSYRLTLPISRKDAVAGRYVSTLLVTALSLVLGVAMVGVCYLLLPLLQALGFNEFATEAAAVGFDPLGLLASALVGVALSLIMSGLMLAVAAKTGLTKAFRVLPLVFVAFVVACMGIGQMVAGSNPDSLAACLQTPEGLITGTLLLLAASAVCYGATAVLSMRFYATRQL